MYHNCKILVKRFLAWKVVDPIGTLCDTSFVPCYVPPYANQPCWASAFPFLQSNLQHRSCTHFSLVTGKRKYSFSSLLVPRWLSLPSEKNQSETSRHMDRCKRSAKINYQCLQPILSYLDSTIGWGVTEIKPSLSVGLMGKEEGREEWKCFYFSFTPPKPSVRT